jgi:tetratricopeptide (TPR) repeat protein
MPMPTTKSGLSPLERHQVRSLILRDSVALISIFLIAVMLAIGTYFLFNSYSDHRKELANRWFNRGKIAMQSGQPTIAIEDFHSALLYAPGQRQMEIALASALASAGKLQEATAYFNTLRETEPGNGEINLQLARLASRSGNPAQAKLYFHAAIYGNWEGDGYLQRRNARLELVRYLISQHSYEQARSELLVASGNAPSSDLEMQSKIAALLVEDNYPADALSLYEQLLVQHPDYVDALVGAAHTAYSLGDYHAAYRYLQRALDVPGDVPESGQRDMAARQMDEELLHQLARIIVLDPEANLPPAMRAARLLADREIARLRFQTCSAMEQKVGAGVGLSALADRWSAEPKRLTASDLLADPAAEERELKLINDTEKVTAQICGKPAGDDAYLLRLAQVPSSLDAAFAPAGAMTGAAATGLIHD